MYSSFLFRTLSIETTIHHEYTMKGNSRWYGWIKLKDTYSQFPVPEEKDTTIESDSKKWWNRMESDPSSTNREIEIPLFIYPDHLQILTKWKLILILKLKWPRRSGFHGTPQEFFEYLSHYYHVKFFDQFFVIVALMDVKKNHIDSVISR